MCRLFGMLAEERQTGEAWLVRSDRSLLAQSNADPAHVQKDGWGIGWYDEHGRVRVEKGIGGAYEDGERSMYLEAAARAESTLVFGHLRHASNPLKLPREQLIGPLNSQPFDTHTALFVHNGSIPFPIETRPFLGVHEAEVKGVNDSEVLFRLLLRHHQEIGDPFRSYVRAVEDLLRVWIGLGRPAEPPYSGLNVIFANGPEELWAFCLSTGKHGCSLIDTKRPYYEMVYHAEPHRLVVGSEPFDGTPGAYWTPLPNGTALHARRVGARVEVTTTPLPTFTLPTPTIAGA
jgi:predicted glutamine amidotransferase